MHVNICVGVTTSQPHTYQTPTELLGAQSVGSKKVPLALLVQSGLADRWWGCNGMHLLFANTQDTVADGKCDRVKEDLQLHLVVQ